VTCRVSEGFYSISLSTCMRISLSTSLVFLMSLYLSLFFGTRLSSFLSIVFLMPLPFLFCIGISDGDCSSKNSLGTHDLVKGLPPLVLAPGGEEGNFIFFPLFYVVLV